MNRLTRFSWWLSLAAALLAAILIGGAFRLAVEHAHDLFAVRHLTGIWMALAQYLDAGIFYPPLEADGHSAGTRYMPALFALIAGLARCDGDYLLAAKLSALISVALLLALAFLAGRRITGVSSAALALTGLALAFPQGFSALLSPHADALAVALSLGGLLLLDRERPSLARCWLAALLFTAALATKFSSLAGPAAAVTFLLARKDRRSALHLLVPFAALSLAGLAALHFGTEGRFLVNFRSLGSGGMNVDTLRLGPTRLALLLTRPTNFLLIWPAAFVALWLAGRARNFALWDWYLLFALGATIVILTSPGTDANHLLELQVAAVLVVGRIGNPPSGEPHRAADVGRIANPSYPFRQLPHFSSIPLLLWALVLAALVGGLHDLKGFRAEPALPVSELIDALPPGACLLGEDASVPVLLGQRPVVMDAFAFRLLAERGLIDDGELTSRIERQQFDVLVMMGRIDIEGESLCPRFHFGAGVTNAMRRCYRFERQVGDYFIYVPAPITENCAPARGNCPRALPGSSS